MHNTTRNKIENGAALIEFAIVLPLLMALVIGIIEFSFSFARYNSLNKVTQEGARFFSDPLQARQGESGGAIIYADTAPFVIATKTFMTNYDPVVLTNFATTDIDITALNLDPLPGDDHIQVTSRYQHTFITGAALSGIVSLLTNSNVTIGPTYNMVASAVLRVQ